MDRTLTGAHTLRIRTELDLSVNAFADLLGVAPYVVRQWERQGEHFRLTTASMRALDGMGSLNIEHAGIAEHCYRDGCDQWITGASDYCSPECEKAAQQLGDRTPST